MKIFWDYIKKFHKSYFDLTLYILVAVFIAILVGFNYYFDIEDSYIDSYYKKPFLRGLLFFVYHGIAYYGTILLIYLCSKNNLKLTKAYWIKSLIGFFVLSFARSVFPIFSQLIKDVPFQTYSFYFKTLNNSYRLVCILGVLIVIKLIFDRKTGDGLYGLKFLKIDFKPYFIMLLIMMPIIYASTILPDILDYYPTYKRTGGAQFAHYYQIKERLAIIIYEFVYLTDFLNVELFFRGFLVIGLSKFIDKDVVLPMAVTYVVLHFGKPMGEAISSAFGGYILGIIALYSRNIWGGVFVHCGIALFMEAFAFLALFRN